LHRANRPRKIWTKNVAFYGYIEKCIEERQAKNLKGGRHIWEDNIKRDAKTIGYEVVDWSHIVHIGISGRLVRVP
jgi:hypothetical protein